MATQMLGPSGILQYDAEYRVLICRDCQYAIQKSAIPSHLLRHKIYRKERQHLLSSISLLDLVDPENIHIPAPDSAPIVALPIISGYCCTVDSCRSLYASSKRMRRHQSETHGLIGDSNLSRLSRPAKLQTFFRGSKLRYFEVRASLADTTVGLTTAAINNQNKSDDEESNHGVYDMGSYAPQPELLPFASSSNSSQIPAIDVNLETLSYFHTFISNTSLTLPSTKDSSQKMQYWQADFVVQALQHRWLMCGLLAISARHMGTLADDKAASRAHYERATQFYLDFSSELEEKRHTEGEEEIITAGIRIGCILQCANWTLGRFKLDRKFMKEPTLASSLEDITRTIQGCSASGLIPRYGSSWDDINNRQEETMVRAAAILSIGNSSDADRPSLSTSHRNTPSPILDRLRALPSRMTEAFGRPEGVGDVIATISAIAILVECCEISFSADEEAWRGMAVWLSKVPNRYTYMVSRHNPAALVVLAYWASYLVKRAEECNHWFIEGLEKIIMEQITKLLPAGDHSIQDLINFF